MSVEDTPVPVLGRHHLTAVAIYYERGVMSNTEILLDDQDMAQSRVSEDFVRRPQCTRDRERMSERYHEGENVWWCPACSRVISYDCQEDIGVLEPDDIGRPRPSDEWYEPRNSLVYTDPAELVYADPDNPPSDELVDVEEAVRYMNGREEPEDTYVPRWEPNSWVVADLPDSHRRTATEQQTLRDMQELIDQFNHVLLYGDAAFPTDEEDPDPEPGHTEGGDEDA